MGAQFLSQTGMKYFGSKFSWRVAEAADCQGRLCLDAPASVWAWRSPRLLLLAAWALVSCQWHCWDWIVRASICRQLELYVITFRLIMHRRWQLVAGDEGAQTRMSKLMAQAAPLTYI